MRRLSMLSHLKLILQAITPCVIIGSGHARLAPRLLLVRITSCLNKEAGACLRRV